MEEENIMKQKLFEKVLNILTPHNVKDVSELLVAVNIYDVITLDGLVSQIFKEALMEPIYSEIYANLCSHLAAALPGFTDEDNEVNVKIFKRLLINKCQEEFEKESNPTICRLGNIRLIGELYKKKMLTDSIMHLCIVKLLCPNNEDVAALCELLTSIGEMIDQPKNKEQMDSYFQRMKSLSNYKMKLSFMVRHLLKGVIYLRKNNWQKKLAEKSVSTVKKYSRDFLLKLGEQCSTELPEGIQIDAGVYMNVLY